jgi:hypothetical protein
VKLLVQEANSQIQLTIIVSILAPKIILDKFQIILVFLLVIKLTNLEILSKKYVSLNNYVHRLMFSLILILKHVCQNVQKILLGVRYLVNVLLHVHGM